MYRIHWYVTVILACFFTPCSNVPIHLATATTESRLPLNHTQRRGCELNNNNINIGEAISRGFRALQPLILQQNKEWSQVLHCLTIPKLFTSCLRLINRIVFGRLRP
ncbi:hypothetical protein FN846DRAFT_954828 [Sphaerosporella brunnea]|uniref:Secreted protein n=1 Tax=Sphaerosporella brunnea TaxID=1250544 RepID=A0A5J5EUI7_9PEZI|nr:hypothetical protein FN846DRAFT_954828 [Sphaerosporella brunnea]